MCVPAVKPVERFTKRAFREVGKSVGLVSSSNYVAPAVAPAPVEAVEQMGAAGGGVLTTAPRGKGAGRRTAFGARQSLINLRNFDF